MNKTSHGALYILSAAVAYACMGIFVKIIGKNLPDTLLVFVRNFCCLLLFLPYLFKKEVSIKTKVFKNHLVRAISGLLNMYCFFYSIRFIFLSDAVLLNNTMPLFIPLIMWLWKRKKVTFSLIPGLILGFFGIILILQPTRAIFHPGALFALASGVFMAISMAGVRELSKVEPVYRILFYYFALSTLFSAFALPWNFVMPQGSEWLYLLGIGIAAIIYQVFLTKGFEKASASKLSPLLYFAVILAGLFDWMAWGQRPDLLSILGLAFTCVGAVICVRAETPSNIR